MFLVLEHRSVHLVRKEAMIDVSFKTNAKCGNGLGPTRSRISRTGSRNTVRRILDPRNRKDRDANTSPKHRRNALPWWWRAG
jgi:hypothetical protein